MAIFEKLDSKLIVENFSNLLMEMEKPQANALFNHVQNASEKFQLARPFFASEWVFSIIHAIKCI